VHPGSIRLLIVDDYERWRHFLSAALQKRSELQIIGEALDGLEAIEEAEQLRPDLILLDIGLPKLNGIEVARRIREVSPTSKILFISENRSPDIVEQALSTGAGGYVVKSDAASELLAAVGAVLEGKRFVSTSLGGHNLNPTDPKSGKNHRHSFVATASPLKTDMTCPHEVGFYSDDRRLLNC
jgi:DNA-binding NarL/FixJ family response regulator